MATSGTNPATAIQVITARPSEIDSLSTIVARSFHPTNPYIKKTFPDTPRMREWWSRRFDFGIQDPNTTPLTAIDPTTGAAVGVLMLRFNGPYEKGVGTFTLDDCTPDHAMENYTPMIDAMIRNREKLMTGRPHYNVELFGVDQAYQGRGIGRLLIAKACEISDGAGYEMFVQANGNAAPFYERQGFEVRAEELMPGGEYRECMMVRPCRK